MSHLLLRLIQGSNPSKCEGPQTGLRVCACVLQLHLYERHINTAPRITHFSVLNYMKQSKNIQ